MKAKKKYTKPTLKKNEPLKNITFASVGSAVTITGGAVATGAATPS